MPRKAARKVNRRGNKEGSIFQLPNGTWRGQVLLGYSEDGKRIRKSFTSETRAEVAKLVSEATLKVFNGQGPTSKEILLSTLLANYLWTFKKPAVSDVTFEWYLSLANVHVVPALGNVPVREITTHQIQVLLNNLRDGKNLSERTVKGVHQMLKQAFDHGVEINAIVENPVLGTKPPKTSRIKRESDDEKIKVIPVADRRAILQAAESDPKMKTALTVLMFTGMRIGEFLALPWGNVDFDNQIITIDRAITHVCSYNNDGSLHARKTAVGDTKTVCSNRKIKVSSIVFDVLMEWRKALPDHLRRGVGKDVLAANSVVFPNDMGNMRTYDGFRTTYRRFMHEHGLGNYTIHSYRHTFATMLLEQGVNPRVVQKLLGHRDIETTLGIYSHVLPEVFGGVADIMTTLHGDMLTDEKPPEQSAPLPNTTKSA